MSLALSVSRNYAGGFLRLKRKRVGIKTLESTTVELDGGARLGHFPFCYIESGLSNQISLFLKTPLRVLWKIS